MRVSVCHCLACKRRTGSAFAYNSGFNADQVSVTGQWKSYARTGESGKELRFHFCPECGATVFYEADARPGLINIPVGSFAEPHFPAPIIEVYPERKVDWCEITSVS